MPLALETIETHTEGMPTRVVVSGLPDLRAASVAEMERSFRARHDHLRGMLTLEPRGNVGAYTAFVLPPVHPGSHASVLYAEAAGYLPGCGHATMGVATALIECGRVDVGDGPLRLDTVAGTIEAQPDIVATASGPRVRSVEITNVASFVLHEDLHVRSSAGDVPVDIVFGGNFYAIVDATRIGLPLTAGSAPELVRFGMSVMESVSSMIEVVHPTEPAIVGCHHTLIAGAPVRTAQGWRARSAVVIVTGVLDRSPCGTGTSARLAHLWCQGLIGMGDELIHESVLERAFGASVVSVTEVGGIPAVVPRVRGRAWVTGHATWIVADDDPFPAGFLVRDR